MDKILPIEIARGITIILNKPYYFNSKEKNIRSQLLTHSEMEYLVFDGLPEPSTEKEKFRRIYIQKEIVDVRCLSGWLVGGEIDCLKVSPLCKSERSPVEYFIIKRDQIEKIYLP